MTIELRVCEIDMPGDRIVVAIEVNGQIYKQERSIVLECTDEFDAVASIRDILNDIFSDINEVIKAT